MGHDVLFMSTPLNIHFAFLFTTSPASETKNEDEEQNRSAGKHDHAIGWHHQ